MPSSRKSCSTNQSYEINELITRGSTNFRIVAKQTGPAELKSFDSPWRSRRRNFLSEVPSTSSWCGWKIVWSSGSRSPEDKSEKQSSAKSRTKRKKVRVKKFTFPWPSRAVQWLTFFLPAVKVGCSLQCFLMNVTAWVVFSVFIKSHAVFQVR